MNRDGRSGFNLFALPVRRPVATLMFFIGVVILGWVGLRQIPIELMPPLTGDNLYIQFNRPGSEPEVVEREILLPLSGRVSRLKGVQETEGTVTGSGGSMRIQFEPGTDLKIRELEMQRMASDLAREQPPGTGILVQSDDFSAFSQFVMTVQVTGMVDSNALYDFVDDRIRARLSAVPGVSQVLVTGGQGRELAVRIDTDRCAAYGIRPQEVTAMLSRSVQRRKFMGGIEEEGGRTSVVLDGRPAGVASLADLQIRPGSPVRLRHVADIDFGGGDETSLYQVNGKPAVGLILFKEDSANLVELGRDLNARLVELEEDFRAYGIGFVVGFDAAELVEEQLDRLKKLGLSGFLIALAVLFLFLRQWRAVAVVGVAVPVSLLAAIGMLYLGGQSLNLISLFGLAMGIGMLVDNSIVVYEAVQRQLERGASPDAAAEGGVRRTVRAILAASLTNAIVFLPVAFTDFENTLVQSLVTVLALAILLPLAGSLLVAVGLVPLLARRVAAPGALARLARLRERRERFAGFMPPDRPRGLFSGMLKNALRRPGWWLAGTALAVLVTVVIALPLVAVRLVNQDPPEASQVQMEVEVPSGGSLETTREEFAALERAVGELPGIKSVESFIREDNGSITVYLEDEDDRPEGINAADVRNALMTAANRRSGVSVQPPGARQGGQGGGGQGGGGGLPGQEAAEVVLSGPDYRQLDRIARDLQAQLASIPEISGQVWTSTRPGREELQVIPDESQLAAFGITADQFLPVLQILRREGFSIQVGHLQSDGREIPLTVRNDDEDDYAVSSLNDLRLPTEVGVLPLGAIADTRKMPPPPAIQHRDGRRETSVFYRFGREAPETGPARLALEKQIREAIQEVRRPAGYTIETPDAADSFSWFKKILLPVLLLLFVILAITFESLTMPILVLIALPLTVLGATWTLVLSGTAAGPMALAGALALIGLTVNPAILLVDRMQQRVLQSNSTAGAAALAAVRERTRPVLMTAATTILGLWPLALTTGRQNEIWPPFAVIVMGGLLVSTLMTLVIVPMGFVILRRLDTLFGRLGPWMVLGWIGAVTAIMVPLFRAGLIESATWKTLTTIIVAGMLLGLTALLFPKEKQPQPQAGHDGPPVLDVRHLEKVYGRPGPVARAWRLPERFAQYVLGRGGKPFDPKDALAGLLPLALVIGGAVYLALTVRSVFWRLIYTYLVAGLVTRFLQGIRRARGKADATGTVLPGGVESTISFFIPWSATLYLVMDGYLLPKLAGVGKDFGLWLVVFLVIIVAICHGGRRTAVALSRGLIKERPTDIKFRRIRGVWRSVARKLFGFGLKREEVRALTGVSFRTTRGMIGILGPNGAGKTTLLRMLAGILDPTAGTLWLGNVRLEKLRKYLARWVGYLPQDFGLPQDMTARGYLQYYSMLYDLPEEKRDERVNRLLEDVGLLEKADQPIGSYSGGQRQRVAVARTLLRLPPVIIVDEPTVGLDPRERIRFRNLLSRLAAGRVVLFSTHVVEDVAVACERVIVITRGRMVYDGEPMALAEKATGRVWEVRLTAEEEGTLPDGVLVADQVPEAGGMSRSRVLSRTQPHPAAVPIEPSLEDGYLWLVGDGLAEVEA